MITVVKENGMVYEGALQANWNDDNNEETMVIKLMHSPRNKSEKRRVGKPVVVSGVTLQFDSAAQAARQLFPNTNQLTSADLVRRCCRGEIEEVKGCRFRYS